MIWVSSTNAQARSTRAFRDGSHLFHQGDASDGLHRIVSGCVMVYRVSADGHRQVEAFLGRGDPVSLCLSYTSPNSAQALGPVETDWVPRAEFERRLLDDHDFRAFVFREIDRTAQSIRQQAMLLACRSALQRVAHFMTRLEERFDRLPDGHIPFLMGRIDIADHLGLTLETVSRMINRLKQTGVIALPRSDRFSIVSSARLQHLSGPPETLDTDDRQSVSV